jgi:hypothetical protein
MKRKLKLIAKETPIIRFATRIMLKLTGKISFVGSKKYWEMRYAVGGTSGVGSYGKFAEFKAEIINSFVSNNGIDSVIELGCGDGNQLRLFNIPHYVGLDISRTAIELCLNRFEKDETKSFFAYDPDHFGVSSPKPKAELALSLDVIYHLVEDNIFELYMRHLFSSSDKFVIIYSTDTDTNSILQASHVKNRRFSKWVEDNFPDWRLAERITNRFPDEKAPDFFIYERKR